MLATALATYALNLIVRLPIRLQHDEQPLLKLMRPPRLSRHFSDLQRDDFMRFLLLRRQSHFLPFGLFSEASPISWRTTVPK
jgi:hypothetical protein